MSRLIREDEVFRILTNADLTGRPYTDAKRWIREIPTAYNLEAVVGQLEAIKKDRFAWCALHNMETCEKYQAGCVDHLLDEIIKLVKAGGKNG